MIEPTTGTVTVNGRTPHRTPPRELIREVGLVPQEPRDLLYADTVAAECAAADADAEAPPAPAATSSPPSSPASPTTPTPATSPKASASPSRSRSC